MDDPETQKDNHLEALKGISENQEQGLLQGSKHIDAVQSLEPVLEGILTKTAEVADNTKPKDIQKVSIDGVSIITIRGDKGDVGPEPTDERLAELIKPLIPPAIPGEKGDDADDPTDEHLLELIKPLIPPAIPGEKGDDADDITEEQIVALIKPLIPPPIPGRPGPKGEDGSKVTGEDIVAKHRSLPPEKRISYEDLYDKPNLEAIIRKNSPDIASKDYATRDLTDVSMQGILAGQLLQWDGARFVPYTPSAGGFTQVFGELVTVVGTAFTLLHTPIAGSVRLYRGGGYQQGGGVDYTMSGASGTLKNATSGEVFLADYNY